MKKALILAGILGLAIVGITAGCGDGRPPEDPEAMTITSYEVPEGYSRAEWHRIIKSAVSGEPPIGTTTTGPNNTIIVTAPGTVQNGIRQIIEQIKAQGPPPAEPVPASITMKYWFLLGRPQSGRSLKVASAALQQNESLQPVLSEIVASQGGMEFFLLEQTRLTSMEDEVGRVRGRYVELRQQVSSHDSGQRLADIKVTMHGSRGVMHTLESRIKLDPEQFVVLGQTAYKSQGHDISALGINDGDDLMLYYVISSEID